jgi:hypothetical protein
LTRSSGGGAAGAGRGKIVDLSEHGGLHRHTAAARYKVLGILDDEGRAIQSSGILALPDAVQVIANETAPIKGKVCPICHSGAMIKREGYEFSRLAGIRGILLGIRLSTGSCSRSSDRSSPA